MQTPLFRCVSLGRSIKTALEKSNFISLIQISVLSPESRHCVTLATQRVVPVRQAKVFVWKKFSRLPGLPYLPRGGNSSILVVSPPETTRGNSYKRLSITRETNFVKVNKFGNY